MRQIKCDSAEQAVILHLLLTEEKIESEVDGSSVWVIEYDLLEQANQVYTQLKANPSAPKVEKVRKKGFKKPVENPKEKQWHLDRQRVPLSRRPTPLTAAILLLCVILFFLNVTESKQVRRNDGDTALNIGFTPIQRELMFDFPKASSDLLEVVRQYPNMELSDLEGLSGGARDAFEEARATPRWLGVYTYLLMWRHDFAFEVDPSLFAEKIQQGEIWRLFTPVLMHGGIIHILFNMLWLWTLGQAIEKRIGSLRLLVLFLVTGIVPNVFQYVVSGPFFMGFSGIVCGLLGFIWAREKTAPWEGYPYPKAMFYFVFFFVGLMFFLELSAFVIQFLGIGTFSPNIANTAHIIGGILGLILGRMNYFGVQVKS